MTNEETQEFINALSKLVLKPLINDWYNNQYTIEQFVYHVFMSGVMFKETIKELNK